MNTEELARHVAATAVFEKGDAADAVVQQLAGIIELLAQTYLGIDPRILSGKVLQEVEDRQE